MFFGMLTRKVFRYKVRAGPVRLALGLPKTCRTFVLKPVRLALGLAKTCRTFVLKSVRLALGLAKTCRTFVLKPALN